VGTKVCFIANFPPRKLKGVESQGMLLSSESADGTLQLVRPADNVENGCSIG
jgi:methionyl-tRNA synthetase